MRILRLIEYLTGPGFVIPIESTHGAGSPQAQKMVIQLELDRRIEEFKQDARIMAGVDREAN